MPGKFDALQWSHPPAQLENMGHQLEKRGALQTTDRFLDGVLAENGIAPPNLQFFEIPPVAHRPKQLVVPFVHIFPDGSVDMNAPMFFGVTARANLIGETRFREEKRSTQVHVYAESEALRNNVFNSSGRSRAELFAIKLMPLVFQKAYGTDRIAHMRELQRSIDNQMFAGDAWKASEPLDLGITGLKAYLQSLKSPS